jgi:hypothetical protein
MTKAIVSQVSADARMRVVLARSPESSHWHD